MGSYPSNAMSGKRPPGIPTGLNVSEDRTANPAPTFSNSGFGVEPICHPWSTLVYSGNTRKTVAVETEGTVQLGYFFPLAWSTAAFSSGSPTSDKVRSKIRSPIFRRT